MKVLLVNGSARARGTTAAALAEVSRTLSAEGVETETVFLGTRPIADCVECRRCKTLGRCVIVDGVNAFTEKARAADGFIFGSPVYFAHPSARLLAFMDRAFYSSSDAFRGKPAAAVLVARRSGQVASMDVINKYFTICEMPVVSSTYWNHVFGANAAEAAGDAEGMATMRNLARNMAWLLRSIEAGRKSGAAFPKNEIVRTNFVR